MALDTPGVASQIPTLKSSLAQRRKDTSVWPGVTEFSLGVCSPGFAVGKCLTTLDAGYGTDRIQHIQELVVVPVHHLYQDVEVPGGWAMGRHGTGGSIFACIEDISGMLVELGSE